MTDSDREIKGVEGGDPGAALRAVGMDPGTSTTSSSAISITTTPAAWSTLIRPAALPAGALRRPAGRIGGGPRRRAAAGRGSWRWEQLDAVRAANQLAEVNGDVELVEGVNLLRDSGRAHAGLAGGGPSVLPAAGGRAEDPHERAIFWGDLIPTRWQLPVRWTSAFDDYPNRRDRGSQRARGARCGRGLVVLLHPRSR